jgi:hypothetical protein
MMMTETSAYIARHNFVFHTVRFEGGSWRRVELSWIHGTLKLEVDDKAEWESQESLLPSGYCFLGVKAGTARIRNLKLDSTELAGSTAKPAPNGKSAVELLYNSTSTLEPVVSIVTTVYDRTACLEACVRSVQALHFDRYEQIIVADSPPQSVLNKLRSTIERHHDGRHPVRLASSRSRANDWGITPAAAGLSMAVGKYVCFLSDDNGYKPEHFGKLVAALEQDPRLGFAYSGCLYDGRSTLNTAPPAYGRIDLGQPLFRRELFGIHLGGALPFHNVAWDWEMIQRFLRAGVRWKHIGDTTFIFRLAKYPALAPSDHHRNAEPLTDTTPAPVN